MTSIIYEDEGLRVYNDGTEEAFFSDEEWAEMIADPAYGYICKASKHRIDGGTRNWSPSEGCMLCFADGEGWEPDEDPLWIHAGLIAKALDPRPMFEVIASFIATPDDAPF